jgi:hypothetical protein
MEVGQADSLVAVVTKRLAERLPRKGRDSMAKGIAAMVFSRANPSLALQLCRSWSGRILSV